MSETQIQAHPSSGGPEDRCVHCAYSLTGVSVIKDDVMRCPECGLTTPPGEWVAGVRDTSFRSVLKRSYLMPVICLAGFAVTPLILCVSLRSTTTSVQIIIGVGITFGGMLGFWAPFVAIGMPLSHRKEMLDRYISAPQLCGRRLWVSTLSCIAVLLIAILLVSAVIVRLLAILIFRD